MNRRLALWTLVAAVAASRFAYAQSVPASGQGEVTIGYQGLPYKATGESPTGIQVSDGVLMHVGAGAEGGYDSNVFYAESPTGAAIYRTTIFGQLTNATRTGLAKAISFDARAGLQYRRYQFIDDLPAGVPAQTADDYKNAWMPTAGLALSAGGGQVGFGLADTFARIEEPPYVAGRPVIIRNNNQASIEGRWAPGGGRLTGTLRYTNMLDIYSQGGYSYADSDTSIFMLDASWRWLPKTAIFLNAQQGYIFYLNQAQAMAEGKQSAYPLRVTTGLRGLLTQRTSAVLSLGYANSFSGTFSTSGFLGSTYAELAFTVRPTDLSRIVLGYRHDFQNSVISSFYYGDTVYASFVQQIAGRLALDLSGRYVRKDYQGLLNNTGASARVDNFFQVGATLDYFLRNWMYAGVGYALLANNADLTPLPGTSADAADYVKQQLFVRVGVTY
jgi:hypothetical protein